MKRALAKTMGKWLFCWSAMTVALGLLSGCGQQTFLAEDVYKEAHSGLLPAKLENSSCPITEPLSDKVHAAAVVGMPERPARYLSLQEAIAIALENGLPGNAPVNGNAGGIAPTDMVTFPGPGTLNSQTARIRVLALNPALSSAAMEASLARFDAIWVTSMSWTNTDALSGGINTPGYLGSVPGQTAQFQSSVIKAFSNGAVANVTFFTDYRNLNSTSSNPLAFGSLNPQYAARMSFGIETPLWRDWGGEINSLLGRLSPITGNSLTSNSAQIGYNNHQAAITSFADRGAPEGILVSRLRFDQSRAEFERNMNILLANAEIAYWNLYNKYGQLYSFEENLRILREAWQKSYYQYKAGLKDMSPERYHQVLGQYEEFRGERIRSMQEVLDAERNLRGILGLQVEDGTRLVPITPPTLAEMKPDWDSGLQEALNLRPELQLARANIKYHQYLLQIQKNNVKPDLRAFARYEPFGDGNTLQGNGTFLDGSGSPVPSNAFKSLVNGQLADWNVGLYLNVPLGFRFENAAVRAARLELSQGYWFLRDQEDRATRYFTEQYQQTAHWYMRIQAHRQERVSYGESLKIFATKIMIGTLNPTDLTFLQVQRSYAAALVKEYNAIAEYNNSMARLEWAKGTILRYNNVHVAEGALPQGVQQRAVEYEKEKAKSLVLCDRPDSLYQPGRLCLTKNTESLSGPLVFDPASSPPDSAHPTSSEILPNLSQKVETPSATPNATPPVELKPTSRPALPPMPDLPNPPKSSEPAGPSLLQTSATQPSVSKGFVTLVNETVTPAYHSAKAATPSLTVEAVPQEGARTMGLVTTEASVPGNASSVIWQPQSNALMPSLPTTPPINR